MYLNDANMPMAGSMTIAAGGTYTSGGVTFLCAEGGDGCEVTVAADGSVEATGGDGHGQPYGGRHGASHAQAKEDEGR